MTSLVADQNGAANGQGLPGTRAEMLEPNGDDNAQLRSAIVIIEPRQLIRECLGQCFLTARLDHEIVAFSSIEEWQNSLRGHRTGDVIVLYYDTRSVRRSGSSDDRSIASRIGPGFNIVLICDSEDPHEVIELITAGARGYIPTSVSLNVAIEAMRLVWAGGVFIPANSLLQRRNDSEEASSAEPRSMFTPRQAAVLEQLQMGKANKIIAFELMMKESTVKVHVRNIMRKVGATNRTEVAVRAFGLNSDRKRPLGSLVGHRTT